MKMSKNKGYKLRWAKHRFKKGNPTDEDLQLLKSEGEIEKLKEQKAQPKKERKFEPIEQPTQKSDVKSSHDFKDVQNPENYHKKDSRSFIEDANATTEKEAPEIDPIFTKWKGGDNKTEFDWGEAEQEESKSEGEPTKGELTDLITGRFLLMIIDFVMPNLISWGMKKFKKKKYNSDLFKMPPDLMNEAEQPADEVAKKLGIVIQSPEAKLALILGIGYGMQVFTVLSMEEANK